MLSLTRKADYALVALAYLGQRRRDDHPPVSARQIAETFGLPLPMLTNILKDLAHAKIVASTRGAQGGYHLAVEPAQVCLLEIITAVDGPMRLAPCVEGLPIVGQGCGIEACCPVREPVRRLHDRLNGFFETLTLADLLEGEIAARREPVAVY